MCCQRVNTAGLPTGKRVRTGHPHPPMRTCTTECHRSFMALSPARSINVSMLSTYHSKEGRKLRRW